MIDCFLNTVPSITNSDLALLTRNCYAINWWTDHWTAGFNASRLFFLSTTRPSRRILLFLFSSTDCRLGGFYVWVSCFFWRFSTHRRRWSELSARPRVKWINAVRKVGLLRWTNLNRSGDRLELGAFGTFTYKQTCRAQCPCSTRKSPLDKWVVVGTPTLWRERIDFAKITVSSSEVCLSWDRTPLLDWQMLHLGTATGPSSRPWRV